MPAQADLPIVVGGRDERARVGRASLGDGYHSSATGPQRYAERIPVIRAAAEAAGRPMPSLAARVRVSFGDGDTAAMRCAARSMRSRPRCVPSPRSASPTSHSASRTTDPTELSLRAERFMREVAPLA